MGPPKQNRQLMMICVRRCALLGDRIVCSVSKALARLRITQAMEPTTPKLTAIISLISMSQRIWPCHQCCISSVGQMSGLMKFIRLEIMTQNTRLDAARLRFLICQTNGGVSIMRVTNARIGTATALGVIGNVDSSIVSNM